MCMLYHEELGLLSYGDGSRASGGIAPSGAGIVGWIGETAVYAYPIPM